MRKVFITGASGFLGFHFVKHLTERGIDVTCMLRSSSNQQLLANLNPKIVIGDVLQPESVRDAFATGDFDTVFHLAGLTKSLRRERLFEVNENGARNVGAACAQMARPPKVLLLSSLAARGPDFGDQGTPGTLVSSPVSAYGKSKLAGELAFRSFADQLDVSIVRSPIVLGEADRDGVTMFRSIANFGLHLVPGVRDKFYSVIYADDLATACSLVAESGQCVSTDPRCDHGTYYAADDQPLSYSGLGKAIGDALGKRVWMIRFPDPIVWIVAAMGELTGQVRRKPSLLNLDKAREATAGSWTCVPRKLTQEFGFTTSQPISQRLQQIILWYRDEGWMRPNNDKRSR